MCGGTVVANGDIIGKERAHARDVAATDNPIEFGHASPLDRAAWTSAAEVMQITCRKRRAAQISRWQKTNAARTIGFSTKDGQISGGKTMISLQKPIVSRRGLLSGAAALGMTGLLTGARPGASLAKAPMSGGQVPYWYRFKLG